MKLDVSCLYTPDIMEKVIICNIVALISLVLAAGSGFDKSSTLESVIARLENVERHILAFNDKPTRSKSLVSNQDKQRYGDKMNARLEAVERQLSAFKSTPLERRTPSTSKVTVSDVTFEVTCEKQLHLTLYGNQIYKFQKVTLNNGGGYHAPTGIFECPVTGTYLFWASILPLSGKSVHVVLMKEKHVLFSTDSKRGPASFSYIVRVRRGEKVWFQTYPYTTVIWCGHSSYGGTLIHQQ